MPRELQSRVAFHATFLIEAKEAFDKTFLLPEASMKCFVLHPTGFKVLVLLLQQISFH